MMQCLETSVLCRVTDRAAFSFNRSGNERENLCSWSGAESVLANFVLATHFTAVWFTCAGDAFSPLHVPATSGSVCVCVCVGSAHYGSSQVYSGFCGPTGQPHKVNEPFRYERKTNSNCTVFQPQRRLHDKSDRCSQLVLSKPVSSYTGAFRARDPSNENVFAFVSAGARIASGYVDVKVTALV